MNLDYDYIYNKRESAHGIKQVIKQILDGSINILKNEPGNVQAANILGVCFAEFGKLDQAKTILSELKEFSNINPHILFNIGQVEFLQKNFTQALHYFIKYLEFSFTKSDDIIFDYENIYTQISQCHVFLNDYNLAISYLKKLILLQPTNISARVNLNVLLNKQATEITTDLRDKRKTSIKSDQYTKMIDLAINYFQITLKQFQYFITKQPFQSRIINEQSATQAQKIREQSQRIYEFSNDKILIIESHLPEFGHYREEAELQQQKEKRMIQEKKQRAEQLRFNKLRKTQENDVQKQKEAQELKELYEKMKRANEELEQQEKDNYQQNLMAQQQKKEKKTRSVGVRKPRKKQGSMDDFIESEKQEDSDSIYNEDFNKKRKHSENENESSEDQFQGKLTEKKQKVEQKKVRLQGYSKYQQDSDLDLFDDHISNEPVQQKQKYNINDSQEEGKYISEEEIFGQSNE